MLRIAFGEIAKYKSAEVCRILTTGRHIPIWLYSRTSTLSCRYTVLRFRFCHSAMPNEASLQAKQCYCSRGEVKLAASYLRSECNE